MVIIGFDPNYPKDLWGRELVGRYCFFMFNYHIIQNINLDCRKELLSENLGD
jgi:hypothetical protein